MIQDASLAVVMSRLREGDPSAASIIFDRFVHRLTALASRQLDIRFRAKAEPEDVVQSVYRSFFLRDERSPFELADWDSLWSLLATITVHKCLDKRSYWLAARRDVGRELGQRRDGTDAELWNAIDRGPTPLQASVLTDILESVLVAFPPKHRVLAEMSFQGYTAVEIASRCDCSERTVARVVARIKELLQAVDAGPPR